MTLETETLARGGLGVGLGLALTGLAVYGYLWHVDVEDSFRDDRPLDADSIDRRHV